jgi:Tol biopolymer transport system component
MRRTAAVLNFLGSKPMPGTLSEDVARDAAIRAQIKRILAAPEFHASQQLIRLLQYLMDRYLADPRKSISEYDIGFEVFGRGADFDPKIDSVVRVHTTRLRQKLARFYAEEGSADRIYIEIRRGYAVNVTFREFPESTPAAIPAKTAAPVLREESRPRARLFFLRVGLFAGVVLVAALAAATFQRLSSQNTKPVEPTVIPFTSNPRFADNASFSPDGKAVAFSGSNGAGRNIYIKQIKSGELRQITFGETVDVNPAWSPDGSAIAFLRLSESSGEFMIAPLTGGPVQVVGRLRSRITEPASAFSPIPAVGPVWTKDRRHLVVADKNGEGGADCLFLINLKDGSRTQLTSPPLGAVGDRSPAISLDGNMLAFVRVTSYDASDMFLVPLAGGQPSRMTFDHSDITGLAWTGDKHQIIFSSDRRGMHRLWRLNTDSKQIDSFPAPGLNALHPAVDPAGNRLIYTELTVNTNIWRTDLREPSSKRKPIEWIRSALQQDSPQYSPDGRQIAFISNRSGYWELWVANASGDSLRQVTHFNGPVPGSPQWSPDGREVAFDLRANGVSNTFVVNVDTGAIQQITRETADTMAPKWALDGHFFYVTSRRTGQLQIWKVSRDGSLWTQLTRNGGFDGTELPEQSKLLFTLQRSPGFWMLDLLTNREAVIPELANVESYRYWAISPEGLYYVFNQDAPSSIRFYDFKLRHTTKVAEIAGALYSGTPSLTVSPDGHYLAYAQVDSFREDLMLAESW